MGLALACAISTGTAFSEELKVLSCHGIYWSL